MRRWHKRVQRLYYENTLRTGDLPPPLSFRQCLPSCFQICPALVTTILIRGPFHRLCLDQESTEENSKNKKYRNIQAKASTENIELQPPIQRAEQPTVQRAMQLPVSQATGNATVSKLNSSNRSEAVRRGLYPCPNAKTI
jgi:hypothetical protein